MIVFNDMIADMSSNKKLNPVVTELFKQGRKIKISLFFIKQSYFTIPKNIRLNSTNYFVMVSVKIRITNYIWWKI